MHAVYAEIPELAIDRQLGALGANAPRSVPLQTWRDNEGRLVATGGHDGTTWWMDWPGLATFSFGEIGPVVATPATNNQDDAIGDVFPRGVLPVVLLARGFDALHGSAVMLDDGGVIVLCATSGTGKSTLALAMTAAGARHFADDTVVYRLADGQPLGLRLPSPIRVDAAGRRASAVTSMPTSAMVPPGTVAPIRRVYALSRDTSLEPGAPSLSPVPIARRFETLLTHAHPFEMGPAARQRAFIEHLLALAGQTDVWECRFAPSLQALPQLAHELCAHARR